jgi:uncharacterized protein YdbL (DUF1318 family)
MFNRGCLPNLTASRALGILDIVEEVNVEVAESYRKISPKPTKALAGIETLAGPPIYSASSTYVPNQPKPSRELKR